MMDEVEEFIGNFKRRLDAREEGLRSAPLPQTTQTRGVIVGMRSLFDEGFGAFGRRYGDGTDEEDDNGAGGQGGPPLQPPIGLCTLDLDSEGGDEGYDQAYGVTIGIGVVFTLHITYDTLTIKDQIVFTSDTAGVIFDSGCVGTEGPVNSSFDVPYGTTSVRIQVFADCEHEGGTVWRLKVSCEKTPIPP